MIPQIQIAVKFCVLTSRFDTNAVLWYKAKEETQEKRTWKRRPECWHSRNTHCWTNSQYPPAKAGGLREIMKGEHIMLLWTMDQMRELQLQWARELYWQEGQARGAIRTCKAMGLDFADALQHLQALLPELPQVNAERLARYYWKEESSANAVAKIDYEIDRRTDREINRVWYGEEYCKSFDEGYINGTVKALAGVIKDYGISLNDSCLQNEADSLNLSLGELRERLDAKLKEMEHPEEK